VHVEKAIHKGFPSREDEAIMVNFHKAKAEERAILCRKFKDTRYLEMSLRLMYAEHPDHLDSADRVRMQKEFQDRLMAEDKLPWLTIPQAFKEIEDLRKAGEKLELLAEIEVFIEGMRHRISTHFMHNARHARLLSKARSMRAGSLSRPLMTTAAYRAGRWNALLCSNCWLIYRRAGSM
jgi:hypothetical protein